MNVAMRVDAGDVIGLGHLMRCLTLADGLQGKGARVVFVSRPLEGNRLDLIASRGFEAAKLSRPRFPIREQDYQTWAGAGWEEDARETREAIDGFGVIPDWLVVDHYGLGEGWETSVRSTVGQILAIDDFVDRRHDCDILLNQSLINDAGSFEELQIPHHCVSMLGPRYALLQPAYGSLRSRTSARQGPIRRILVAFGGSDHRNLADMTLRAFLNLRRSDVELDIVVGQNSGHVANLLALKEGHPNVRLHVDLPSLAPLMAEADLAVGAGGSTSWERLSLGLPSLIITVALNQVPIAEALDRRGLAKWLGHCDSVTLSKLQAALSAEIERGSDPEWSRRCLAAVDGNGVQRVVSAMLFDPHAKVSMRRARKSDEALLLDWANDPEARSYSFSSRRIDEDEHHRWFSSKLRAVESCRIFIAETDDRVPLGQVRFDKESDAWKVSYSVDSSFRGKGLGQKILELALETLRAAEGSVTVFGQVAGKNLRSQKVFRKLGFAPISRESGIVEFRLSF
jgi:UDP-2,4-diacetamido-2,4,6-trideoxy-beta-L-altropyranose hydrolase